MSAEEYLAYDPSSVKPGWLAFWIVVALCVATFLLWRSMNHQLRKIQMPPRPSGRPRIGGAPATPSDPDAVAPPRGDDDPAG
jgi:hypothetical protein